MMVKSQCQSNALYYTLGIATGLWTLANAMEREIVLHLCNEQRSAVVYDLSLIQLLGLNLEPGWIFM